MALEFSESELTTMKQAVIDGHSAAQIAAMLPGRSRNSIIGKVNQMKKAWGVTLKGRSAVATAQMIASAKRSNLISKNARHWSDQDLSVTEIMWAAGDPVERIAAALQRTVSAVNKKMSENRARFPLRVVHKPKSVRASVEVKPDDKAAYDDASRRLPLWELERHDCRHPGVYRIRGTGDCTVANQLRC